MHGLVNRSIQCFLRDTYGAEAWADIVVASKTGIDNFEALLIYDDADTAAMLDAASAYLNSPKDMILEDVGTYLVSSQNVQSLRRLLRFGGETFVDFLHSLDELYDRVRLAVAELSFPMLELRDHSTMIYTLLVSHSYPGFGHVLVGVLRAMADDYGALVLLEHKGRQDTVETISIELLEMSFAEGNEFALAAPGQ